MNGLTTLVLGIMLGSIVVNSLKTETYDGCSQCYSKSTDNFIPCLNKNCKKEILSKEVLFEDLTDSIKADNCAKCIENQGQSYYDCLTTHCSSIIKAKAIDLALHSPWKIKKLIPLGLNSCKKCLQTITNHENSASCYYFSCSQELNHQKLLKSSQNPSPNCKSCSDFQGPAHQNCVFLFCSQEISTTINETYPNLKALDSQCMNYCYTQSLLTAFDYFQCHAELCGNSQNSIEVYHNSQSLKTSKCESCHLLFTGASFKTCQSLYCISDFRTNFNKNKLFDFNFEFKSKCESCLAFDSEISLKVCLAQNCKSELKPEFMKMIENKKFVCGFNCEEVYFANGLSFDKFYDCVQRECQDELGFVYRIWMNRKDLQFVEEKLCKRCFEGHLDGLESICAFCFRQVLVLDTARDRMRVGEERCRVGEDDGQVVGLVLAGCGKGLIKALGEAVLYDPTILSNSKLSISSINKYLTLFTGQSLSSISPNHNSRSEPDSKLPSHLSLISKSKTSNLLLSNCAESISKVHKSSKSNFIQSSQSKCQMTKVQSEIYLLSNLKPNSLKQHKNYSFLCTINPDLADKNYCNDLNKPLKSSKLFESSIRKIDYECKSNCFKSSSYSFDINYSSCKAKCPVINTRNELCDKCWDEYNNGQISKDDYVECMKFYCRAQITELTDSVVSNDKFGSNCGYCLEFEEKLMVLECVEYYCEKVTEKVAFIVNQEEFKLSKTTCSRCYQYALDQENFELCVNLFCSEEILNEYKSYSDSYPYAIFILVLFLLTSLMILLYRKTSRKYSNRDMTSLSSPLITS